ncbi:MAG: ferric reductase-like transmembrane domain-containing protein [Acidobacteriota bacterium]|nr:ferric reductase-like transmembrane domain-containing protein [Acidobacteriota bacterium]
MSSATATSHIRQRRLRQRLLKHHLPLLVLTVLGVAALYFTRPYKDAVMKASFATAYPALALLAATLLVGPWNVLRRRQNPVSSDLRRDVGIWAGMVGVLHSAIGQCVHLRGRPWLYYVYGPWEHHHRFPLRHDLFGLANYTGAAAVLALIALLATSNDYALRALGTPRWKQLQRWNYAVFALTAVHAFSYQGIEKQHLPFVATVAVCVAIAAAMQTAGWISRRRSRVAAPVSVEN